jgi:thiol peroxidase
MARTKLDGLPVNTSGELPGLDSMAPTFTLVKSDLTEVSLEDFKDERLVLNIFPSIETNVCASSVRKFNQLVADFENLKILCISKDLPFAHHRFCAAEGIQNLITLSNFRDENKFARDYGVLLEDGPFKGLNARAVVIMNENGRVVYSELVDDIGNEPDYEAVMKFLKKFHYN